MSDHTTVLLPLESWAYAAPELVGSEKKIDIGLFAEALIYYDCVIVNPSNQLQLAEFINWFIQQGCIDEFYSFLQEGELKIYDYAFMSTAIKKGDIYSLWNMQDPIQAKENTFEQRFLYHESIEQLFPKSRHRAKLYNALRDNVVEVKAGEFNNAIENARDDFNDPRRNAIVVQAFVDELYKIRNLGRPPKVEASITDSIDGTKHHITFNIDFLQLASIAGQSGINFHNGTPLTASAH